MDIGGYIFNDDYLYDYEHNWVKIEEDIVTVGVTDFFQKKANEIVFIEIPLVGRAVVKGVPFSSIESGKWVGRLKAPLSGKISEVNSELADFPYLMNESPYEDGWVMKMKIDNREELDKLSNLKDGEQAGKYAAFIEAEGKRIADAKGK